MKDIAVIMPVWHTEEYLAASIESVLAQTYRNYMLYIVLDGEDEACGQIADAYRHEPSVEIIHAKHGGLSHARNVGLSKGREKYVAFLDSDDAYAPEFLEHLKNAIETTGADIASCQMTRVTKMPPKLGCSDQNGRITKMDNIGGILSLYDTDDKSGSFQVWNRLYKRSLFDDIPFPEGCLLEDVYTVPFIYEKCSLTVLLHETLVYYRMREGSIMASPTKRRVYDLKRSYDKQMDFFSAKKFSPVRDAATKTLVRSIKRDIKTSKGDVRRYAQKLIRIYFFNIMSCRAVSLKEKIGTVYYLFGFVRGK